MPDVAATGPALVAVVLLVGLAVGLVSTIVPVLAVEAYVVSAAVAAPLPLALGAAAVGQTVARSSSLPPRAERGSVGAAGTMRTVRRAGPGGAGRDGLLARAPRLSVGGSLT